MTSPAFDNLFVDSEVQEALHGSFYAEPSRPKTLKPRNAKKGKKKMSKKPEHYKVICISLYTEDLAALDAKVAELKGSGHRKMSRSALIRYALDTVDLDGLPRSY